MTLSREHWNSLHGLVAVNSTVNVSPTALHPRLMRQTVQYGSSENWPCAQSLERRIASLFPVVGWKATIRNVKAPTAKPVRLYVPLEPRVQNTLCTVIQHCKPLLIMTCVYIVPQGRYIYNTCSVYSQNHVHIGHLCYYVRVCMHIAQGLTVISDVTIQSGDVALHEQARQSGTGLKLDIHTVFSHYWSIVHKYQLYCW